MTTKNRTRSNQVLFSNFCFNMLQQFGYDAAASRGVAWANYATQHYLKEEDVLDFIEIHYTHHPVSRIYVSPSLYIEADFYPEALWGMLQSFEVREAFETCSRIKNLIDAYNIEDPRTQACSKSE